MSRPQPNTGNPKATLGLVILYAREERGWSRARAGACCGVSAGAVEDWENGKTIPNANQWARLRGSMSSTLGRYTSLLYEAKQQETRQKLAAVLRTEPTPAPTPEPTPDEQPYYPDEPNTTDNTTHTDQNEQEDTMTAPTTKPRRKAPEGSRTMKARLDRITWAKAQLAARPHMRIGGADGLKAAMVERWGSALSYEILAGVKDGTYQVPEQQDEPLPFSPRYAAKQEPQPAPDTTRPRVSIKETKPAASAATREETLETAVKMILEAIPDLASLQVEVSLSGETGVTFSVRQVQSGALRFGGRS